MCPSGIVCGNLNPQASSKPTHLPRHGLTAGSVTLGVAWGENKARLPTSSKWQIRLGQWLNPYRGGCGTAAGGAKRPPSGDSKGRSPWRAFGDFPRDGKVTRVPSMALPCSRGAPAGGCWDYQSRKKLQVQGGAPASRGVQRGQHPLAFRSAAASSAAIIPHPPAPGHSEKRKVR